MDDGIDEAAISSTSMPPPSEEPPPAPYTGTCVPDDAPNGAQQDAGGGEGEAKGAQDGEDAASIPSQHAVVAVDMVDAPARASTSSGSSATDAGASSSGGGSGGSSGGGGATRRRPIEAEAKAGDDAGTGTEHDEATTDNRECEEETAENGGHDTCTHSRSKDDRPCSAAAAATTCTRSPARAEVNRRQEKKGQGSQGRTEISIAEGEEKMEEQAAGDDGIGGDSTGAVAQHDERDGTYAQNDLSPPRRSSTSTQRSQRPAILTRVPSEPGAYHVQPVGAARRGSTSRRNSHSDYPGGDIELADFRARDGLSAADDGVSIITEPHPDPAAVTTIATPLEAHTYVEAIEVIAEEPEGSSVWMKMSAIQRNVLISAVLVVTLALAIGLGVGIGRGNGGGGKVVMPSTFVSEVPVLNSSKLVELHVTFESSSPSSVAPVSRQSDPDSILLGLGASALVKGSPSASEGGLVQVFDREQVEKGSNAVVYNETLRTSPFTSPLPRGVVPEEVLVGPAFDSSGRIINVAISFLGKGNSPGFVRIFERENGKGVLPNGREWWQVGQDVGLGLVNDFIDVQSDGFASGYGASVGYSPNVNGHLIVGSHAGFARLYFLQQNSDASRWIRIDGNRIMSSNESSTENPVIVASRNYRFAVAYPREGAGTVSLFETVDPRTGRPLDLDRKPLEPPLVPGFRQIGQTLEGLATGDGFGWSLSMDIRGSALAVGCESGGYVQTFRFNEETSALEQFGHTIVGDPEDEGSFGRSLTLGYYPANAGSCPICNFQLGGLRMIVGSPSYNSTRGRATVFEYSDSESEWKRFPSLVDDSDTEQFGHSVSLSIEQSTVAATYDNRGEIESTDNGTRMWRIVKV